MLANFASEDKKMTVKIAKKNALLMIARNLKRLQIWNKMRTISKNIWKKII